MVWKVWFLRVCGFRCSTPRLPPATLATRSLLDGASPGNEPACAGELPERQRGAAVVPRRAARAGYRVVASRETGVLRTTGSFLSPGGCLIAAVADSMLA